MNKKSTRNLGWVLIILGFLIMFYITLKFFVGQFLWILLSSIVSALGLWMVNKK